MDVKKELSFLLALVLIFSLAVPVAAEPKKPDEGGETVVMTATLYKTDIKVEIPTAVTVILNPLGLTVDASAYGGSPSESDQVICATQYIKNYTDMPVKLGLKADVSTEGGITLADSARDSAIELNLLGDTTSDGGSVSGYDLDKTLKSGEAQELIKIDDDDNVSMAGASNGTPDTSEGCFGFYVDGNLDSYYEGWNYEEAKVTITLTFTFEI